MNAQPLEPCACETGTVTLDEIPQSSGSLANVGALYVYHCENCGLSGDYTDTIEEATQIWNDAVANERTEA